MFPYKEDMSKSKQIKYCFKNLYARFSPKNHISVVGYVLG